MANMQTYPLTNYDFRDTAVVSYNGLTLRRKRTSDII